MPFFHCCWQWWKNRSDLVRWTAKSWFVVLWPNVPILSHLLLLRVYLDLKKWSKAEKTTFTRQMSHLSGKILTLAKICHTNWAVQEGACQSYLKSTKWPPPARISLLNGSSLSREMQTIALTPMNAPVASSVRVQRHRCAESASWYSRDLGLISRITDKADGFPHSNSSSWNKEHGTRMYHTYWQVYQLQTKR